MKNKKALLFFKNMANVSTINPNSVKLANNTDYSDIDAEFIMKYAGNDSKILDIGTGSGLIVNKIYNKVKSIDCVEPYANFTKFIVKSENIKIHNCNIFDYEINELFNIVTIFGTMHYFNEEEAISIYEKIYPAVSVNGYLIIKNQFGVNEDVNVSGYSEEQKTDYYAQYRHIQKEVDILSKIGFKNIKIFDNYPVSANRWKNTHFYTITGQK